MLQFNLLPDVKKEYIKAKRQKHLIFSVSILSAGVSLLLVGLLFSYVQFGQKQHIEDLTEDIDKNVKSIKSIEDIDKILTIQSQLEALPELHGEKPETSRIFSYLTQLTPADVKIRSVALDLEENTLKLEGSAPSIASVNRFADTLKFAKYKSVEIADPDDNEAVQENIEEAEELIPFTEVQTELSRNEESARYSIQFTFEPVLFDNSYQVKLIIPEIVTTRSTLGKPEIEDQGDNPLFEDNSSGGQ